jgi:hypothetical protein
MTAAGGTPAAATGTVALPNAKCMVTAGISADFFLQKYIYG